MKKGICAIWSMDLLYYQGSTANRDLEFVRQPLRCPYPSLKKCSAPCDRSSLLGSVRDLTNSPNRYAVPVLRAYDPYGSPAGTPAI